MNGVAVVTRVASVPSMYNGSHGIFFYLRHNSSQAQSLGRQFRAQKLITCPPPGALVALRSLP